MYEEATSYVKILDTAKKVLIDEMGEKIEERLTVSPIADHRIYSLDGTSQNNSVIAGIDQATEPFWRWEIVDNGGANLTLDDINDCLTHIIKADSKFTCAVTNPETFQFIAGELLNAMTFTTSTGKLLDLGDVYQHLYLPYAGGLIIGTPAITNNVIYFTTKSVSLALFKKYRDRYFFKKKDVGKSSYSSILAVFIGNQVFGRMNDLVKLQNYALA